MYNTVAEKGGEVIVPPRGGGIVNPEEGKKMALKMRNNALKEIIELGGDDEARAIWKKLKGYHIRSLVEAWISRFKRILGGGLRSREESHQDAEVGFKVKIMNKITSLRMPISYPV